MNSLQIFGDFAHVFALCLLLFKIENYKSAAGISGKSQVLLCLVFTTRYIDLFTNYISVYNSLLKVVFIFVTYVTVCLIYSMCRKTYEKHLDTFRFEFLILPVFVLAMFFNYTFTITEVLWAFSEYLEAVAMWPQFFMICKTKEVKKFVFCYLTALGLYRGFYIANWIYKYRVYNYCDPISVTSGCIQVVPYLIFWCLCVCGGVRITKENSWFGRNLAEMDDNGIFTIKLREGEDYKKERDDDTKQLITLKEGEIE